MTPPQCPSDALHRHLLAGYKTVSTPLAGCVGLMRTGSAMTVGGGSWAVRTGFGWEGTLWAEGGVIGMFCMGERVSVDWEGTSGDGWLGLGYMFQ